MIVCQGDMNDRLMSWRRHLVEPIFGPAGNLHHWLAGAQVADGHVLPADPHAEPGAQCLGAGLFRGPPFGIGACHILAPLRFALLHGGENTVAKTVAKAVKRALDTVDVGEVCADAEDHCDKPVSSSSSAD